MQSLETDNHPMLCERRPLGPRAMYLACSPVRACRLRYVPSASASIRSPAASPRRVSPHAHDPASRPPAPRSAVEHVSLSDAPRAARYCL